MLQGLAMTLVNRGSSVQHTHPLLYWVTIAYIVGVPNFLEFDVTGRTHEFGLFNVTSISRIALTLLTAYVLVINLALGRGPIFPRKVKISTGVWIALLLWCTIATILQPASRLSPSLPTDLPLSFFRLGEWVLAFVLFLALYAREPAEDATALIVELIGRCSWIIILMVWVALPLFPHLIYGSDEPGSPAALGGVFINPGFLAFESCLAFFYSLFFFRPGLHKWLACFFALITLEMTRSRTSLASFIVAFSCYAIFYSRKSLLRWVTISLVLVSGLIFIGFRHSVMTYVAKGQSAAEIASLDGRTEVWQASVSAIRSRPMLGYGFVIGAKNAIKDHWIYAHWIPPSAHSEFIQALLVGGIPACAMILYVYMAVLWRSLRSARHGAFELFLMLAGLQVLIHSMFAGEGMMAAYGSEGAVLLLCWIGFSDCPPRRREHSRDSSKLSRPMTLEIVKV
jgi:O-antigen ligase